MSLNIKSADAERLARELAAVTGESITGAVTVAVRERLERVGSRDDRLARERLARVHQIMQDAAPRWVVPYGAVDHADLLYDALGLPR